MRKFKSASLKVCLTTSIVSVWAATSATLTSAETFPLINEGLTKAAEIERAATHAWSHDRAEPFQPPALAHALADELADDLPHLLGFNEPIAAYHLSGEYDQSRLTFEYDAKTLGATAELVLAYKNAVSVMPEASRLVVEVNGKQIGELTIKAPAGSKPHTFKLPAHLLKDGTNEVILKAHQRHRVDCSFGATYELWTQIDPVRSGIRPQNKIVMTEFSQLKTIQRADHGLTNINLVLPSLNDQNGAVDLTALNNALSFTQTMALVTGRDDISITVSERPGFGPGIDLFLSAYDMRSVSVLGHNAAPLNSPISIVASAEGDRAQVTLHATSQSQLEKALLSAVKGPLKPFIENTMSHSPYGEIFAQEGQTYLLSDAGFKSTSFSGRLFRTDFTLNLPSDFYPADYASIDLALNAATSPGLNVQSQLLVRVNGSIVKSLPMRDRDGQVFEKTRIELPLRAFRAGKNQVEILAEVGRASDHDCLYQQRDETTPRFILLDNTEIRVPYLARISRLPELSTFAERAYPYADVRALDIHVLQNDPYSLSAALTLLTKMSGAAKTPLNANIFLGSPDKNNANNKLIIAPQNSAAMNQIAGFVSTGSDIDMVGPVNWSEDKVNWSEDAITLLDNLDQLTTASTKMVVSRHLAEGSPDDLLAHFKHLTKPDASDLSFIGRFKLHYEKGLNKLKSWLAYQPYNDHQDIDLSDTRQARLTQTVNDRTGAVETWLIAANPIDAMDAADLLANPTIWDQVHGADIALHIDQNSILVSTEPVAQNFQFTNTRPGNLRRVLAAWLSDHFLTYVIMVITMIGLFGFCVARIIPHMGVKNEQ